MCSTRVDSAIPTKLRVLSWNIDMDSEPFNSRIVAMIRAVRHEAPDIVCLQELTNVSYKRVLQALCTPPVCDSKGSNQDDHVQHASGDVHTPTNSSASQVLYTMHCPSEWYENLPYFCAMLTRRNLFSSIPQLVANRFSSSKMFRGYIHLSGTLISKRDLSIITTHLESLPQSSLERKQQLLQILDVQRDCVASGHISIVAADTNLRENEVSARLIQKTLPVNVGSGQGSEPKRKKSRVQAKFQDAWVLNGMNPETKFTWDMTINDNLSGFSDFKPRARYDRAFILCPSGDKVTVPEFRLVGKKRLDCGKFISDHWGMLFTLDCQEKVEQTT